MQSTLFYSYSPFVRIMNVNIIFTFLLMTWQACSESGLLHYVDKIEQEKVENGFIKWGLFGCQIVCDYGFISSGEHVFPCSNEHPTCVQTMAFIIGR